MVWVKGQSGNPGGRAKGEAFRTVMVRLLDEVKRGKTTRERLVEVAIAKGLKGDLDAITWLVDRVDGKIADRVDLNSTGRVIVDVLYDRIGGTVPLPPGHLVALPAPPAPGEDTG